MKTRILALIALTACFAFSFATGAATVSYDVVIDLSDSDIYAFDPSSGSNITTLTIPLVNPDDLGFTAGDNVQVTVGFSGSQRLTLSQIPVGPGNPSEFFRVGMLLLQNSLEDPVFGGGFHTIDLIDPAGDLDFEPFRLGFGWSGFRGVPASRSGDWTDSSFSIGGLSFLVEIGSMSGPVIPDTFVLEFRDYQLHPVPVPPALLLMLTGLVTLTASRRRPKVRTNRG